MGEAMSDIWVLPPTPPTPPSPPTGGRGGRKDGRCDMTSDLLPEELGPGHAALDALDVAQIGAARGAGMPGGRIRQAGGELGRLVGRQVGRRLAEVSPARRLRPVEAAPEFHHVQVQLQDPPLVEGPLDLPGQDRLLELAERVPRG